MRRALAIALCLTACSNEPATGPRPTPSSSEVGVPLTGDDFVVTGSVRIRPGIYEFSDPNGDGVIQLRGKGARVDLTGVTLRGFVPDSEPDDFAGIAISVRDAPGAVVTGGTLSGFRIGVRVSTSPDAVVEDVHGANNFRQRLHSDVAAEDVRDWLRPHDNDAGEWETKYGATISVSDSPRTVVRRCSARTAQNGLLVTRSDHARVYDNDFSFLSGWGIALYRTSDAVIARNKADWCVRGFSHGVYDRGQDSAGILLFEQCSRNTIALNSATHGGDGLFLYAGEETLRRTGDGGCNDNIVWRNDFSHAVANAIEATFSRGNAFVENRLDDARHGVWAGYSWNTRIVRNTIDGCDHGISIEHGHDNVIEENEITRCDVGVHLWWDEDAELAATRFGRTHDLRSRANRIGPWNTFRDNGLDIHLQDDRDGRIVENTFGGERPRVRLEGNVAGLLLEANDAPDTVLALEAEHQGRVRVTGKGGVLDEPRVHGFGKVEIDRRGAGPLPHLRHAPDPAPEPDPAVLPGTQETLLPDDHPRGRHVIFIDDWGPIEPTEVRVFPRDVRASGAAQISVVGVTDVRLLDLTPGFVAEVPEGAGPGVVTIRAAPETPPGTHRFAVTLELRGKRYPVSGTLFHVPWDVRLFRWVADPRDDATAWSDLLASEPAERRTVTALDFVWQHAAPSDAVGADRFATLATATAQLAAGRYRLATVSDDGIRVWVDDELVVDDWTHHGPTPHDVELQLATGRHTIRVEHFELDGWAVLSVRLDPL